MTYVDLVEQIRAAAAYEAACWDEVVKAGQRRVGVTAAQEEHAQAVGALLLLTRQLTRHREPPRRRGYVPRLAREPQVVAPHDEVAYSTPVEFFDPLKPEKTVRRVEGPPPLVVVPPVEKDPATVKLTDNQWRELQNLGRAQRVPVTDIQRHVLRILTEAKLARPVGTPGAYSVTDAGRARLKAGREPQ